MVLMKTLSLFALTALAEIIGCYLPYLVFKQNKPIWLIIPAIVSLMLFVWLLTLHPAATGRVYAAYGGVYIGVALCWLYFVDEVNLTVWDVSGALVIAVGVCIIIAQPSFAV